MVKNCFRQAQTPAANKELADMQSKIDEIGKKIKAFGQ